MSKIPVPRFLLDVNTLVAILDDDHIHHQFASEWFDTPNLLWAVCSLTEAGFLRYMTNPKLGGMAMSEATAMLARLAQEPGYQYQPISTDWQTLCGVFFKRLFGHNQITDAYLLGVAVREGLVLVTFDRAILHLAGEHAKQVLILEAK